jgi:hypothetical protein
MAHTPNTNRSAARCSRPAQRTNYFMRCFNAMRANGLTFSARRASGVILPMIVAMLLLATAPRMGWAQCPTSSPPAPDPSTCPWNTNSITITVPGTSCTEVVSYCWRVCGGGQNEVWVYSIQPGSGCGGLAPSVLINAGLQAATDTMLIDHSGMAVCPGIDPIAQVSEYIPTCWQQFLSGEIAPAECSTDCICTTTCNVCMDTTTETVTYSDCSTTHTGTCVCTPDPGYPWLAGVCYTVCSQ